MLCDFCDFTSKHCNNIVTVGVKGIKGINYASEQRGLSFRIDSRLIVHVECRNYFTKPQNVKKGKLVHDCNEKKTATTRGSKGSYDFKTHCILCGNEIKYDSKHNKRGADVWEVKTLEFQKSISGVCAKRQDEWANDVQGRIQYAIDLFAEDTIYHQSCSVNFHTGRQLPKEHDSQCNRR